MASTFDAAQADNASGNKGGSTFDQALAAMPVTQDAKNSIANVYAAYNDGRMTPDQSKAFEADVQGGKVLLPRGAELKGTPKTPAVDQATANIYAAYSGGQMTPEQSTAYERDVRTGAVPLPSGAQLKPPPSMYDRAKEAVTGSEHQTRATQDLPSMTEAGLMRVLHGTGVSTATAAKLAAVLLVTPNPQEQAQILRAASPDLAIAQDEKGNLIVANNKTGEQFPINPPGLDRTDVLQGTAMGLAFTPAGRAETLLGAGAKAALTQTGIEGAQAATGGEFNPGTVAEAGLLAPIVPAAGRVLGAVAERVTPMVQKVLGRAETGMPAAGEAAGVEQTAAASRPTAPTTPPAASAAPAPAAVSGQARVAPPVQQVPVQTIPQHMGTAELAATAKQAAEGSKKATQILAEQASPDAETLAASKRLGIEDYLQPDHVSTNQAYRETVQAIKSMPGSEARAAELEGLQSVAKRADDLIEEIGGTNDLSHLDSSVKSRMQATQTELEQKADDLYGKLRATIPAKAEAPATNVIGFVTQRAEELGGKQNLSSAEKQILAKLQPKSGATPTYALLDDVRKDLGNAARQSGPFKDADTGLAKKLYSLISDDQSAVVAQHGMADTFAAAKAAVTVRKGLEDDMTALFGKQLDRSLVGDLAGAMKALPAGDATKLARLVSAVPPDMRQQVVASGLNTAFGKSAQRGALNFSSFAKWYDGLQQNKQAAAALFANLPAAARQQLADLARVSSGIAAASKERITTGRLAVAQDAINAADSFMASIYSRAKQAAVGAAAGKAVEPVTTAIGLPGAGVAAGVASALARGKPAAMKAADALIASPAFIAATKAAGQGGNASRIAAAKVARSSEFTRFLRELGNPREMQNREQWVLRAMESENNRKGP